MNKEQCWYKTVCTVPDCGDSCLRYAEMSYLLKESGIPEARQHPEQLIAGDDYKEFCRLADIKGDIQQFVLNGSSLYIASTETGNGKTSWAIKLLLKYFDCIWAGNGFRCRGLFIHVPSFLLRLKDFDNPMLKEYLRQVIECDVVVWDDIAATKLSPFDISHLLMYLDGRLFNKRANIYTGNLVSIESLGNACGSRLASRIWNGSEVIIFRGKDRR